LQADALDFLGDAGNYAISLFVVGMALRYRAMAAFIKGATMGVFGLWVLGVTAWHVWHATLPHAVTMGAVGMAALFANAASFGPEESNGLRNAIVLRVVGWSWNAPLLPPLG
jgi:Co/Zn/Cd efflux system component